MTAFSWDSSYSLSSLTLGEFITNARVRFDEATADIMTDLQMITLINAGILNISFLTKLYPETATLTLDNSTYYTLPSGLIAVRRIDWIDSSGRISLLPNSNEVESQDQFSTARPAFFMRRGNRIYTFGNNTGNGTLTLYGNKVPALTTDTAIAIDMPNQYMEALYYWIGWWYFVKKRIPDEAEMWKALYLSIIAEIKLDVDSQMDTQVSVYGPQIS